MRITLNLDAEVLAKVRSLAKQRSQTMGAVASELILRASELEKVPCARSSAPLLPADPHPVRERSRPDIELVNRLRDDEP